MVACDHIEAASKAYYSHVIYSDDHGQSWKLGGTTPEDKVNECEVAELFSGELLLNMRNYDRAKKFRQTAISEDGGLTWTRQRHDESLVEPICQASLQAYHFNDIKALLFSNPSNREKRVNMSVRVSFDDGHSWRDSIVLDPGPSAYSDLVTLYNGQIGCLFENGKDSPYETIVYAKLDFETN